MRRRSSIKPLRQWLAEVRPLMEEPDTPPKGANDTDVAMAHLFPQHRRLAYEHGVSMVVRALGLGIEDPVAIENWIRNQRLAMLERAEVMK